MQEQDRICEYILKAILRAHNYEKHTKLLKKNKLANEPHIFWRTYLSDMGEEHRIDVLVLGPTLRQYNVQIDNTPRVYGERICRSERRT